MRRLFSIALVSLALTSGTFAHFAHAEGAQSNANTPRLAVHKAEIWLALAEPKPSVADVDAGMGVTSAVEERITMLITELAAVISRRRTLMVQATACRQKIAELRAADRDAPRGENGIKRANNEAKIIELEKRATDLEAQAEGHLATVKRLGDEERELIELVVRVRGVADQIESSSLADAKQKQKGVVLASKTIKSMRLHASVITTVMQALQPTSS